MIKMKGIVMAINDQPHLSNDQLRSLLEPLLDQYDVEYDDQLEGLQGKLSFDRVDVERVIDWKFGTWPARLQATMANIAKNSDRDFENLTSRAFRSDDDLAALLLVMELSGVGKALGSAILMARDPARYTVIDVNAAQAIQALGYLRDPPSPREDKNLPTWDRYLAAARDLALRTGWTLRNIDRTLFKAGQTTNEPN
jgi:hypothetical protein